MFQNRKFIEQLDNIVVCLSVHSALIELVVERGRLINQQIKILQDIEAKLEDLTVNDQEDNRFSVKRLKATGSD